MSHTDHISVMLRESLQALAVGPGGRYVDGTTGAGGHARAILDMSAPGGQLLGLDADPESLKVAGENLSGYEGSFRLVNANFSRMEEVCREYDFYPVHGIILDLGLASMQLTETGRGFSFQYDKPLDMRFSPDQKLTAAEIVNTWSETEIADILYRYGEERRSRAIARRIVESRPLKTTTQLANLVAKTIGRSGDIHPATRTFQALRIAVNDELARLEDTLEQAVRLLGYSGRLVVISYHSLEDRIVKQFFQRESVDCVCPVELPECRCGHTARLRVLNRKVMTPTDEEVRANPRARSARLRAAERILSRPENEELPREDFFLNKADYNVTDRHCLEAGIPTLCAPGATPLKGRSAM